MATAVRGPIHSSDLQHHYPLWPGEEADVAGYADGQVRQTSRKPDEMYSLLERISPGTRKVEIFARSHNLRPGWVSLGNQLPGIKIVDPEMLARYESRYGPISESDKAEAAAFDPSTIPP